MEFIIIIGLIILNGLLSMSEIALVSSRKARLESLAKKGKKSALKALELSKEPDRFLSTIQIGITLIGILTGLFSGEAFAGSLAEVLSNISFIQPYAYAVSKLIIVVIVTYLTLVLGELVPKRIGLSFSEQVAMIIAKPMDLLSKITAPFVWVLSKSTKAVVVLIGLSHAGDNNKVTEEEIKAIVHEGFEGGEVQEVEHDIVERVFHLGDRTVGSIMTHRSELVCIDLSDNVDVIRKKVKTNLYNTYPVISEKLDNIQGVVFLKDLFGYIDSPDFSLSKIIRPAQFIQENMSVYKALEQFRQARTKYGVVTDEFGSVQGIVTFKDIVDALVGEVSEIDDEPEIILRKDGSVLVDGQCSFYSFLEYFDMEDLYEENDYNTLSGLILEVLERVPKTGDSFSWMGFEFEIIDMDGARIDKVLARKKEESNIDI
ncbi:MAG: hemolysin family protein [Tannerella sp.]|jgi:putative hemolysin|nr:hemolysin family protein [Tannerella sp.]